MNHAQRIKKGCFYSIPNDMKDEEFYSFLDELVLFCKFKKLSIRQVQFLFEAAKDYILETELNGFNENNDIHEISNSLKKIAEKGIDTFSSCASTNIF